MPDLLTWGKSLSPRPVAMHDTGLHRIPEAMLLHLRDIYDVEIRSLDDALGLLLDGLRAEGILDDTVFVITTDHGERLDDHGLMDHVFSLHRSICHVPLVIRHPLRFATGARIDDVVRLQDVLPTLLELCGLPVPAGLDGRTLLSDVPGRPARGELGSPPGAPRYRGGSHRRALRAPFEARLRSLYDGVHHLIRCSDGREELYDVRADPLEVRNPAARPEERERLARLRALLEIDGPAQALR